MEIAYATTYDALNVRNWSGSGYYLSKSLKAQQNEIRYIGNLTNKRELYLNLKKLCYLSIGKKFLKDRDLFRARDYARQVSERLSPSADVIFSPGTLPIAFLETKKPKVFYTDSAFGGMVNYYKEFTNLSEESIRNGHAIEQLALDTCSLAIYSSEWAAQTAVDFYNISRDKIAVIPFGANIECTRSEQDIRALVASRSRKVCKLLFLGVDWKRKGGDLALEVARRLNAAGIPTELHVAGIRKLPSRSMPSFVHSYGFISKSSAAGRSLLDKLFSESHFLLVPSKFEAFGVVFSEASSFGLPSLSTKTGGITTAIHDHVNGITFNLNADPDEYVGYMQNLFLHPADYEALSLSSFRDFKERLNWEVSGKKMHDRINALL